MCSKLKKCDCLKNPDYEWIVGKGCRKPKEKTFVKPTRDELWTSDDPKLWKRVLKNYDAILSTSKKASFKYIDDWYYNELPKSIEEHEYITKEEHVKLLEWKLRRGQYRPALMKYANALTDTEVMKASQNALKEENIKKMLEEYSVLKGVGVATASALCSAKYETLPFMSDELLATVIGGTSWKYTWKEYKVCLDQLEEKHKKVKMSQRDIEKVLFITSL